jgi:hypothetical protein
MTSKPVQLTMEDLVSAVHESAHSDFFLDDSGINEYALLREINRLIKEKQSEK